MGATVLLAQHLGSRSAATARNQPEPDVWSGQIVGTAISLFGLLALGLTLGLILAAAPWPGASYSAGIRLRRHSDLCAHLRLRRGVHRRYNLLGSIFRGLGDSRTPLLAVAIACVGNVGGGPAAGKRLPHGGRWRGPWPPPGSPRVLLCCLLVIRRRGLPFP